MLPSDALPIEDHRTRFLDLAARGPVVITSPTGSGKSTQVPRWCAGRVLVVEPRRLACRALAQRVAELEDTPLGNAVGYSVRDEHRAGPDTRIVFATAGVVLRMFASLSDYATVVLDEFHERSLDSDLLLGLLHKRFSGRLVVMSATLEGERVARHLGGAHLQAEGRAFPVTVHYTADAPVLPSSDGLDARVLRALDTARNDPGDVLVFLPGKGEISDMARALRDSRDFDIIELHGELSLDEQRRAFRPAKRRKVILATNVAETSLTIPGVGVVIDAGLVRQTRYRQGRGHLALVSIAQDSADQRAGRAGRTAPGVCYRLWHASGRLASITPPEIHRQSLVPFVLAAAVWGETPEALPLLDPPKDHALASAREELYALGALDERTAITARGHVLFGLPLDAHLARLLVEARSTGCLDDAIDLVAALGAGRPLFAAGARPEDHDDDLRAGHCDVTACVLAVRIGEPARHRLNRNALEEARRIRARLRRAHGLPAEMDGNAPIDRARLARTALAADPRCVHLARRRGRDVAFSNGGTEIELARESAVRSAENVEAIAVLETRAFGADKDAQVVVTCATPVPIAWIAMAGLGRDRLAAVTLERGRIVARVERVYAKRVIAEREESPTGEVARAAICELFVRGSLFRDALPSARSRLAAWALASRLRASGREFDDLEWQPLDAEMFDLAAWVAARLVTLGVESGDDLALLSPADLVPPELPDAVRDSLDREFPRVVHLGDASYEVDYDLAAQQVTLRMVRGTRRDPPPLAYLPKFPGFKICVEAGRSMFVVRR